MMNRSKPEQGTGREECPQEGGAWSRGLDEMRESRVCLRKPLHSSVAETWSAVWEEAGDDSGDLSRGPNIKGLVSQK